MSTPFASPVDGPASGANAPLSAAGGPPHARDTSTRGTLVWDAPVRVGHWLMVLCFAGAWLTAESERLALVHVSLGYTLAGLVVFRVLWGLVGTRHARFAAFVRGPAAVADYLRSLWTRQPQHHVGHNPAGALAIVGLLAGAALLTASGWANFNDLGGEWLEELHEFIAQALLALVAVHVAGVVVSSRLHRENLVKAMLTGRKPVAAEQGIRRAWWPLGLCMLAAVAGFWAWQLREAAAPATGPEAAWRTGPDGRPLAGSGEPGLRDLGRTGRRGGGEEDARGDDHGRRGARADRRRPHRDGDDD